MPVIIFNVWTVSSCKFSSSDLCAKRWCNVYLLLNGSQWVLGGSIDMRLYPITGQVRHVCCSFIISVSPCIVMWFWFLVLDHQAHALQSSSVLVCLACIIHVWLVVDFYYNEVVDRCAHHFLQLNSSTLLSESLKLANVAEIYCRQQCNCWIRYVISLCLDVIKEQSQVK